jgi:hypothetical protein
MQVFNYYSTILIAQWLISPWLGVLQIAALLIVWIHACISIHFRLHIKPWSPGAGEEWDSAKGRWGGSMSMSAAAKKYRCRTYPAGSRRGTGLRRKDDGGRVNSDDHSGGRVETYRRHSRKIIAAGPIPPAPARIVPSRKGRWGWAKASRPQSRKLCLHDLYPLTPRAGEETGLRLRTMEVGQWC